MSEYWKSIPKIYCKFCNVWYQDNRASKDFHERSFKHKNNINRHIADIQKRTHEKQKEEDEFKIVMQGIEKAAMVAYEKDLIKSGKLVASTSKNDQQKEDETREKLEQQKQQETSDHLREQALEAVTSKLKKKHEWYESKTSEGKIYYYNRITMETKWTEPKSGFISIEEQKDMNLTDVPGDQSNKSNDDNRQFKHEQFKSSWQQVSNDERIDLQLPESKIKKKPENKFDIDKIEKVVFKDKIVDNLDAFKKKKKDKNESFGFKKRKLNNNDNLRIKSED